MTRQELIDVNNELRKELDEYKAGYKIAFDLMNKYRSTTLKFQELTIEQSETLNKQHEFIKKLEIIIDRLENQNKKRKDK